MAKTKSVFVCSECKNEETKWMGQCPSCKKWSTMEERENAPSSNVVGMKSSGKSTIASKPAQRIKDIVSETYTHQSTGIGELDRVLGGGLVPGASIILAGPPGVGKALALNTPIITPNGWKNFGDLKVGDKVYGDNGKLTNIVAVSETWENRPCYEITFSDGSTIIADENHEWVTEYEADKTTAVRTTKEIAADVKGENFEPLHAIRLTHPLQSTESFDGNVYTLGRELASGTTPWNEAYRKILFTQAFTRLGFLQGIMSIKGSTGSLKRFSINVDNDILADFIVDIINSLGFNGSRSKIDSTVSFATTVKMFHVNSWDNITEDAETHHYRYITRVEKTTSVPVRCIQVDNPSHLFLAGKNMVPTHNSSILSHVASIMSMKKKVLYVSGEESVNQIKLRAERTNTVGDNFFLASENDLSKALWHIEDIKPDMIIVDSMQTIASPDIDGRAGSPSQVTEVATLFTRICKDRGIPLVMVGHFTKDGNVAGPRTVEHLVDVVLSFEGEDDSPLRFLRAIKNRFGSADEIGCFEHTEDGLDEVPDPSGLLLGDREHRTVGVCSSIFLEGKRPLPVEIQALVATTFLPNPRRVTSGLDGPRTLMLQAVVNNRGGIKIADKDVYVSTIAGTKIKEPAVDLATVVALISSATNQSIDPKTVAIGEVTLSGAVRKVPGMLRRLNEAIRLGFEYAFVPAGTKASLPASFDFKSIILIERSTVSETVQAVSAMSVGSD